MKVSQTPETIPSFQALIRFDLVSRKPLGMAKAYGATGCFSRRRMAKNLDCSVCSETLMAEDVAPSGRWLQWGGALSLSTGWRGR